MSISRTIRRNIAKKEGTFVSQKPLRSKSQASVKDMLLQALRGMEIQRKANKKKEIKAV